MEVAKHEGISLGVRLLWRFFRDRLTFRSKSTVGQPRAAAVEREKLHRIEIENLGSMQLPLPRPEGGGVKNRE
jgi:hypothetical protein